MNFAQRLRISCSFTEALYRFLKTRNISYGDFK
jgi:hypothetical protein